MSVQHNRYPKKITQNYADELEFCEPIQNIRSKIQQLEQTPSQTRIRREKFMEDKRNRKFANSDISLSISNNASALFSNKQMRSFQKQIQRYQSIANLTQQQNANLKEQNKYLIERLKRMKQKQQKYSSIINKAKKFKALYYESLEELNLVQQQCEAYKKKAEEMKSIALRDLEKLEAKLIPAVKTNDDSQSEHSHALSSPNFQSQDAGEGGSSYVVYST